MMSVREQLYHEALEKMTICTMVLMSKLARLGDKPTEEEGRMVEEAVYAATLVAPHAFNLSKFMED